MEGSAKSTILCESSQSLLYFGGARISLCSGYDVMLGEINLVNIIEDWDVLAEYAGEKLGFYQFLTMDGTVEIRVQTGRVGFKREFALSRHQPFGKTTDYVKNIENADSSKVAKLIKLVGMLLQTKVYLFWTKR